MAQQEAVETGAGGGAGAGAADGVRCGAVPPSCVGVTPQELHRLRQPTHRMIRANGILHHVATYGQGPVTVVLCHGFPELGVSWHPQAVALAAAGYFVLVPDMRGYGGTDAPTDVAAYTMEVITADMIGLLDALHIPRAVFVGHDWGGAVVWALAAHYSDRVQAVAGINTPYIRRAPVNPVELLRAHPGRYDYQLYFWEDRAIKELEADIRRTLSAFIRSNRPVDDIPGARKGLSTRNVRERGGVLVGLPKAIPPSSLLPPSVLREYVAAFKRKGFAGPLYWYRNLEANWRWEESVASKRLMMPALMVTAGGDLVLTPRMSEGMEEMVPNLTRAHAEECSHWTQFEKPEWLAQVLVGWVAKVAPLARL